MVAQRPYCDITAVLLPTGAAISGSAVTAGVGEDVASTEVAVTVSGGASWRLYRDAACTDEIANKTMRLNAGANTAYIRVIAENGAAKVYTLSVTRAAPPFVAAIGVVLDSWKMAAGTSIVLRGVTVPVNATSQTIVFSIVDAGTTGATLAGDVLYAASGGNVTLRATVVDGIAAGEDYVQDVYIRVEPGIEQPVTSVAVFNDNRIVPPSVPALEAAVVPANADDKQPALAVGPNPAKRPDGKVGFFRQGKLIENTALTVYDASGNVIRKITISDKSVGNQNRRLVGEWDLRDNKGRPVSSGAYLVRGTVVTADRKREKVSIIIGVR
jgi:hypothetical protein